MKNNSNEVFSRNNIFYTLLILYIVYVLLTLEGISGQPFLFVFFAIIGGVVGPVVIGLIISGIIYLIKKREETFLMYFYKITSFVLALTLFFSIFGRLS